MAKETLYRIKNFNFNREIGVIESDIELNGKHPVFEGHFPGNPVLPGVCTIQVAKDLLCKAVEREYRLSKSSSIKYLGFISPVINPFIRFQISLKNGENVVYAAVTVVAGNSVVCSFKGDYVTC